MTISLETEIANVFVRLAKTAARMVGRKVPMSPQDPRPVSSGSLVIIDRGQSSYYRLRSCECGQTVSMLKDVFSSMRWHLSSGKCVTVLEKPWSNWKIVKRFGEKIDGATFSWYTEHVNTRSTLASSQGAPQSPHLLGQFENTPTPQPAQTSPTMLNGAALQQTAGPQDSSPPQIRNPTPPLLPPSVLANPCGLPTSYRPLSLAPLQFVGSAPLPGFDYNHSRSG
jgi:hypothetical protein